MNEFTSTSYARLKRVSPELVLGDIKPFLFSDEEILSVYKGAREFCIFTERRILTINIPGIAGKRRSVAILPYGKIVAYTVATTGNLDSDGELCLLFQELGAVKFEFTGPNDIMEISEMISAHIM